MNRCTKYLVQRRSLDTQTTDEQQRAAQTVKSINNKYDNEIRISEIQLADVNKRFAQQVKDLRDMRESEKRNLLKKHYQSGLLENQFKPYLKIKFSAYIKRAILF